MATDDRRPTTDSATPFRVHFSDGSTIDVSAEGPDEARKLASKRLAMPAAWRSPRPTVTKVKRVRESADHSAFMKVQS